MSGSADLGRKCPEVSVGDFDDLGDLYANDVVDRTVHAVSVGVSSEYDGIVGQLLELFDLKPAARVVCVLVHDVSGEDVRHSHLHDLDHCSLHTLQSAGRMHR